MTRTRDRGQAVLLLLPVIAIAALFAYGAARAGDAIARRAQAQAAADAAALAGVAGGAPAASRAAGANGGVVVQYREVGDDVIVRVVVDGAEAAARATDGP